MKINISKTFLVFFVAMAIGFPLHSVFSNYVQVNSTTTFAPSSATISYYGLTQEEVDKMISSSTDLSEILAEREAQKAAAASATAAYIAAQQEEALQRVQEILAMIKTKIAEINEAASATTSYAAITMTVSTGGQTGTTNGGQGRYYMEEGAIASIAWDTQNAVSCVASGDWSGVKDVSGTYSTKKAGTYSLTCKNSEGDKKTVSVKIVESTNECTSKQYTEILTGYCRSGTAETTTSTTTTTYTPKCYSVSQGNSVTFWYAMDSAGKSTLCGTIEATCQVTSPTTLGGTKTASCVTPKTTTTTTTTTTTEPTTTSSSLCKSFSDHYVDNGCNENCKSSGGSGTGSCNSKGVCVCLSTGATTTTTSTTTTTATDTASSTDEESEEETCSLTYCPAGSTLNKNSCKCDCVASCSGNWKLDSSSCKCVCGITSCSEMSSGLVTLKYKLDSTNCKCVLESTTSTTSTTTTTTSSLCKKSTITIGTGTSTAYLDNGCNESCKSAGKTFGACNSKGACTCSAISSSALTTSTTTVTTK